MFSVHTPILISPFYYLILVFPSSFISPLSSAVPSPTHFCLLPSFTYPLVLFLFCPPTSPFSLAFFSLHLLPMITILFQLTLSSSSSLLYPPLSEHILSPHPLPYLELYPSFTLPSPHSIIPILSQLPSLLSLPCSPYLSARYLFSPSPLSLPNINPFLSAGLHILPHLTSPSPSFPQFP